MKDTRTKAMQNILKILDGSSDAFFMLDKEFNFIYINKQAQPLLRRKRESLLGKNIWQEFPKAIGSNFYQMYYKAFKTGRAGYFEEFYPPFNTWFRVHAYPSKDGLLVCFSDITKRKEMEKRVDETRALLEMILDTEPIGFALFDKNLRYLRVNQFLADLNGLPAEEHLGKTTRDVVPSMANEAMTKMKQVLSTGKPVLNLEISGTTKSGSGEIQHRRISYFPARSPDGEIIGAGALVTDVTKQKTLEEALRESGQRFRAIFENAGIGITLADLAGQPLEVNSAFENMTGFSKEELKKMIFLDFTHPEDQYLDRKEFKLMKKGRLEKYNLEKRYVRKDGKIIWVHITVSLIRNHVGKPKFTIGAVRDITKFKQTQEELIILSRAVEQSPSSIIITDIKGNIEYVNPKFTQVTGYSSDEVIGKNPNILKSGETPQSEYKKLWGKITLGDEWRGEFHNKKKTGELFWESASISPVRDSKGVITHFLAVKEDITERKKVKEELKLYSKVIEEAPDGVQIIDLQGKIMYSNRAVKDIYGFSPEDLRGKDVNEMNVDPQFARKFVFPSLKKTGYWSGEILVKHKNGRNFPIWLKAAVVKGVKGETVALAGIIRDITERKELEARKDEFISIASHELKTPITSIKLLTQILPRLCAKRCNDTTIMKYFTRIDNQVDKLTQLINDLLDVSKIQAGKLQLRRELFSMSGLVKEVASEVRTISKAHKIIIKGQLRKRVYGDRIRIGQVLINLLSNAMKYSPEDKAIKVVMKANSTKAILSVMDQGVGIGENYHSRIFERFYQVKSGDGRFPSGLGIGLYVANEIIKLHGSEIKVESKIDQGSTFYFSLPFEKNDE
ncbi:PAS domain S-box protein [Candidatus Microgenomates bacterium]|nr:PAS domain S-box protein [Candidatus Microgenomates bacterium]